MKLKRGRKPAGLAGGAWKTDMAGAPPSATSQLTHRGMARHHRDATLAMPSNGTRLVQTTLQINLRGESMFENSRQSLTGTETSE